MRQQEEQENTETIHGSQDPALAINGVSPDTVESIESDPELTALAAHLDATAPSATVDPAFRKALRGKLLDILAKDHIPGAGKAVPDNISETISAQDSALAVNDVSPDTVESIESDPELTALAAHLDATTPPAVVDPAFRKALRDKLLDTLSKRDDANSASSGQDPALAVNGIDPDILESIENNLGLLALAACLDATAPPTLADPCFREALRDKLEGNSVVDYDSEVVERALEMTERALTSGSRE
jgi:hypothetical protein